MADRISADETEWFVGIGWGSESHQLCVLDANGRSVGERSVRPGGAGLAEACDWLVARTVAAPGLIAVAIEAPHGPVVETFLERGFQAYAINPGQLDRFRGMRRRRPRPPGCDRRRSSAC